MGNFYVNYTLRGVTQEAVAKALAGRTCIMTPSANDTVVAFDEESENQDQQVISSRATELSQELRCPVLAVLNHDDDILWHQLYTDGKLQDEYDSSPGYFDPSAQPSAPAGGDAAKLCSAFGSANTEEVDRVLRKSSFDDDGYTFAFERHGDLVSALGISTWCRHRLRELRERRVAGRFVGGRYHSHGVTACRTTSHCNGPARRNGPCDSNARSAPGRPLNVGPLYGTSPS